MNEKTAKFVWFVVTPIIVITAAMSYELIKIYMVLLWLFALGLSLAGK